MDPDEVIEQALVDAERAGATVSWSDCSRCDKPRDEHVGPLMRCPTE